MKEISHEKPRANQLNRREFLKKFGKGSLGLAVGGDLFFREILPRLSELLELTDDSKEKIPANELKALGEELIALRVEHEGDLVDQLKQRFDSDVVSLSLETTRQQSKNILADLFSHWVSGGTAGGVVGALRTQLRILKEGPLKPGDMLADKVLSPDEKIEYLKKDVLRGSYFGSALTTLARMVEQYLATVDQTALSELENSKQLQIIAREKAVVSLTAYLEYLECAQANKPVTAAVQMVLRDWFYPIINNVSAFRDNLVKLKIEKPLSRYNIMTLDITSFPLDTDQEQEKTTAAPVVNDDPVPSGENP